MPTKQVPIGALSAIYAGNVGSEESLIKIGAERSLGSSFESSFDETYVPIVSGPEQTGDAVCAFDLTFVPDFHALSGALGVFSNLVMRVAKGNSLEGTVADDAPSTNQKFVFLLISADPDSTQNYLVPVCWPDKKRIKTNFSKKEISTTPINFIYRNRNRFIAPYRSGTQEELAEILDTRSPF